jgi:8-oxo-dGTP diphosphatase
MTVRLRTAARAVVVDDEGRVLLVRFRFRDGRTVWTTVGGGVEAGETHEAAARRELLEEAGLEAELGPEIWRRTHFWEGGIDWDGQTERYFLVRTPAFDPEPGLSWEQLEAEGMTDIRWWTVDEIAASEGPFAPRGLADHLHELLEHGPPLEPIDVGV